MPALPECLAVVACTNQSQLLFFLAFLRSLPFRPRHLDAGLALAQQRQQFAHTTLTEAQFRGSLLDRRERRQYFCAWPHAKKLLLNRQNVKIRRSQDGTGRQRSLALLSVRARKSVTYHPGSEIRSLLLDHDSYIVRSHQRDELLLAWPRV